jgi:hypothetical protein
MVAGLVGAALCLTFRRPMLSGLSLAVATMVKATPVFTVPSFARAAGPRMVLAWAVGCVVLTAPFLNAGPLLWNGLSDETGARFNQSAHLIVEVALHRAVGLPWASLGASVFVAAAMALAGWVAYTRGGTDARAALVGSTRILGVYLLVAPVVMPWYLTWLAPLIALELRRGNGRLPFAANDALACLWLAMTASLSQAIYVPGNERLWFVIRAIEYVPVYGILAYWLLRRWRAAAAPSKTLKRVPTDAERPL